jgi:hypothetical protein
MGLSRNNGYQPLPTNDGTSESHILKSPPIFRSSSDNLLLHSSSTKTHRSLPYKTKRFIKRRLSAAGLKTNKMSSATYAPLPPAILGDIENGDFLPSDDEKGWTIVLSRRKRKQRYDNVVGKSQDKGVYKSVFTKDGSQEDHSSMVRDIYLLLEERGRY